MNIKYARAYNDEFGESRMEALGGGLEPQDFAPPAEPANIVPFLATPPSLWFGVPPSCGGEVFHPVPQRQTMIVMRGLAEVTTSDGDTRRGRSGTVGLFEDHDGQAALRSRHRR